MLITWLHVNQLTTCLSRDDIISRSNAVNHVPLFGYHVTLVVNHVTQPVEHVNPPVNHVTLLVSHVTISREEPSSRWFTFPVEHSDARVSMFAHSWWIIANIAIHRYQSHQPPIKFQRRMRNHSFRQCGISINEQIVEIVAVYNVQFQAILPRTTS